MLEVACFNIESALNAQDAGADRIELCTNYEVGGTTPSYEMLKGSRASIRIPIFAMIRPRGGNFIYTATELQEMKTAIMHFQDEADGFVFGILDEAGNVDIPKNRELVVLADSKPCTFHRAIDQTADSLKAANDIIQCGFRTILTSGSEPTALDGAETIAKLIEYCKGKIEIMPGGSIRSTNIAQLQERTTAHWYHSAAMIGEIGVADENEINRMNSYSSTSNGETTSYREATHTNPSGTTVQTESREPGQPAIQERYTVPSSGTGAAVEGAGARGRIEDVTDEEAQKARDKEYEERMEGEYAKREGGA
ncbi:MAG: hypothetical protein M1820_009245 [Bogoriella megaspora]|nr:MAG: hypothetical protein M1820_009245 [Bogoriella megaspora]